MSLCHNLPRDTRKTTWAVSLVVVSPPFTVVDVRGDLVWDVAVPTVVLVTVEAPAVELTVFVPGMVWRECQRVPRSAARLPLVVWSPMTMR